MSKKMMMCTAALSIALLSGCASVPMESAEKDKELKAFPTPSQDQAGLYIFRDSSLGPILKKTVKIDDQVIGEPGDIEAGILGCPGRLQQGKPPWRAVPDRRPPAALRDRRPTTAHTPPSRIAPHVAAESQRAAGSWR